MLGLLANELKQLEKLKRDFPFYDRKREVWMMEGCPFHERNNRIRIDDRQF
jgi:hypothetical protein